MFIFHVRKFCRDEKKDQLNLQLMPFQGLTGPIMQFPPTSGVIWSETDMKYAHGNFFFYRKRDNIHNLVRNQNQFSVISLYLEMRQISMKIDLFSYTLSTYVGYIIFITLGDMH